MDTAISLGLPGLPRVHLMSEINHKLVSLQLRKAQLRENVIKFFPGKHHLLKLALVVIEHLPHEAGRVWAARATYARECGISVRTVVRQLRELCKCGFLVCVKQGRGRPPQGMRFKSGNHYRIAPKWLHQHFPDLPYWTMTSSPTPSEQSSQVATVDFDGGAKKGDIVSSDKGDSVSLKKVTSCHPKESSSVQLKTAVECSLSPTWKVKITENWKPSLENWQDLERLGLREKATEACVRKFVTFYLDEALSERALARAFRVWVLKEDPNRETGRTSGGKRADGKPDESNVRPDERAAFERVKETMKQPGGFSKLSEAEQKTVRDVGGEVWFADIPSSIVDWKGYAEHCKTFAKKWRKNIGNA